MQRPQTITALITIVAVLLGANFLVQVTPAADAQAIVGSEATFVSTPRVVSISTVVTRWTVTGSGETATKLTTTRVWSDGLTEYLVNDGVSCCEIFNPGVWIALD